MRQVGNSREVSPRRVTPTACYSQEIHSLPALSHGVALMDQAETLTGIWILQRRMQGEQSSGSVIGGN